MGTDFQFWKQKSSRERGWQGLYCSLNELHALELCTLKWKKRGQILCLYNKKELTENTCLLETGFPIFLVSVNILLVCVCPSLWWVESQGAEYIRYVGPVCELQELPLTYISGGLLRS